MLRHNTPHAYLYMYSSIGQTVKHDVLSQAVIAKHFKALPFDSFTAIKPQTV